jgi:adenine specific DNA methylase Mod
LNEDISWYTNLSRELIASKRRCESIEDICKDNAEEFKDLLEYLYSLEFDEEPKYTRVIFHLTKMMLDKNIVPSETHLPWFTK